MDSLFDPDQVRILPFHFLPSPFPRVIVPRFRVLRPSTSTFTFSRRGTESSYRVCRSRITRRDNVIRLRVN